MNQLAPLSSRSNSPPSTPLLAGDVPHPMYVLFTLQPQEGSGLPSRGLRNCSDAGCFIFATTIFCYSISIRHVQDCTFKTIEHFDIQFWIKN